MMKQRGFTSPVILVALGVVATAAIIGGAAYFAKLGPFSSSAPQQTACTMEAKLCPDGSSVGRTGPNCEFAACPAVDKSSDETAAWKIYKNDSLGVEFKYPPSFTFKESSNRGTSATTIQDTVNFESDGKRFVFDRITSDGRVPPYAETDKTETFNEITWKKLEPSKDAEYCDGGQCSGIAPSYYFFRDGYQYGLFYYSDDLKQTIEGVLSTFKFL